MPEDFSPDGYEAAAVDAPDAFSFQRSERVRVNLGATATHHDALKVYMQTQQVRRMWLSSRATLEHLLDLSNPKAHSFNSNFNSHVTFCLFSLSSALRTANRHLSPLLLRASRLAQHAPLRASCLSRTLQWTALARAQSMRLATGWRAVQRALTT